MKKISYFLLPFAVLMLVGVVAVINSAEAAPNINTLKNAVNSLEKKLQSWEDRVDEDGFNLGNAPESLSIGTRGRAQITSGKVTAIASSTITVTAWQIAFTVHQMPNTQVIALGGGKFMFSDVKVGDVVDVRGTMDGTQVAFIHAELVRDRSVPLQRKDDRIEQMREQIRQLIDRLNKLLAARNNPPPPSTNDSTAPSIPTNLSASVISSSQINLSWTASTDNVKVTSYKIYRCAGVGCTPIDQIAIVDTTSYQNTGLSASTTYVYAVAAHDGAGNMSAKTPSVSATTQPVSTVDTTAPSKPANISAGVASASTTQINIAWDASTDNVGVIGYKVYRCAGASCTPTDQIATTSSTSYQNTGLLASTTYMYNVGAYDAAGNNSEKSNTASATTP